MKFNAGGGNEVLKRLEPLIAEPRRRLFCFLCAPGRVCAHKISSKSVIVGACLHHLWTRLLQMHIEGQDGGKFVKAVIVKHLSSFVASLLIYSEILLSKRKKLPMSWYDYRGRHYAVMNVMFKVVLYFFSIAINHMIFVVKCD